MTNKSPVTLITGAGRRIGAQLARSLHEAGYRIIVHYNRSVEEASALVAELNEQRPDSAAAFQADLNDITQINELARAALAQWQRLDVLINNASSFYPTPLGTATAEQWDDLINSNLKAPFFLTQALAEPLRQGRGCVVNIVDIHAERPLKGYPIYSAAKAGHVMLTKSLARELAPDVRVNAIAPGAILWPEQDAELAPQDRQDILDRVPLKRSGNPLDIAETVLFLIKNSPYITGQIIAVDGGRSVA
ncbi:pteridine reductase [Marinimicrobium sp. ABcell2]|uniref:pteridine reductase n=1 Tax=Marinimicrobium sp. ABcell2 TaxID=3069751 RepID=UPI0027B8212E|nr:pteridine reductase [Marinimicrobium sp. ABcell2]MDQ2077583.1 pteridine reductase [Marinimicrobium sp. ABcell2]